MLEKKSGPRSHDAHDRARRTHEEISARPTQPPERQHPRARTEPGHQIANGETHPADGCFQGWPENVKRVEIHEQMQRAIVQKERAQQPPIFAAGQNGDRLERAESVQGKIIGRSAEGKLDQKHGHVQADEDGDGGSELTGSRREQ